MFQNETGGAAVCANAQPDRLVVRGQSDGRNDADEVEDEQPNLLLVTLSVALPCSMARCCQPTTRALMEQDALRVGLWSLAPICPACADTLQATQL
ncbi:MAG: hypothetical protein ABI068_07395 [Ktedonobacterales bacterium]